MPIDIQKARRETPGCDNVLHFNNAGAALIPAPVLDAVVSHLHAEAQGGAYEAAERARPALDRTYAAIAELVGCNTEEVALCEHATRAWDMLFYSIPFRPGDRILTSASEYASNYIAFLQVASRTGAVVEVIPNDSDGQICLDALEASLDERVRLVSLTHVPTNSGVIHPAVEVGRMVRRVGALFLLDACQSVGQMPTNVTEIGCDFLTATGRKFLRGPRGTGFLYARKELIEQLEPPFLDLHAAEWVSRDRYVVRSDARRFENWEANIAGQIGLGVAVDYALSWSLSEVAERVQGLAAHLREGLSGIPAITVRDRGVKLSGIVTFTHERLNPADVRARLMEQGINVSVSWRGSTRIDMEERGLDAMVRASVHYYNTEAEVERFCGAVAGLV